MSAADVPRHLGRYAVLGTLGTGAMGEVLRARDERLGREVAIKTVRNLFGVDNSLFRTRFEAEARALAALSHPAIVGVHDLGFEGDEPYLVMELVDGPTLRTVIEERGPLRAAEVRGLGIQLARALEAAHARGILHRDIKPANVLLAPTGQWKLADFGVAHIPDSSVTMTGQFLGTPAYSAPEALALGQFGEASDVFGLAVVLIEAATGERVRGNATLSQLVQRSDQPVTLPAGLDDGLRRTLAPALSLDPRARPSAGRLAELLAISDAHAAVSPALSMPGTVATAALSSNSLQTASSVDLPAATVRPPAPRRGPWIVGGTLAGLLAIGLIAALSRDEDAPAKRPAAAPSRPPVTPEHDQPELPSDGLMQISMPPDLDKKGVKEWSKVAEMVERREWHEALDKLDKFEDRFGRGAETAQLRAILEQLAARDGDRGRDDD